jgi:hypothetical protein
MALMTVGVLVFLGGMIYGALGDSASERLDPRMPDFADRAHDSFERSRSHGRTFFAIIMGGIGAILVGAVLRGVGARGAAGSGIVLDPERAREDLEPWTRMAGGMAEDALSEIPTVQRLTKRVEAEPAVHVRCRGCKALNDEYAKFCDQCGAAL